MEFDQVVSGNLIMNANNASVISGLPTATTTSYTSGTTHAVDLRVTNNTGVGRTFTLTSTGTDLSGGAFTTPVYLPAGTSSLVTVNIVAPTVTTSTVEAATMNIITNTSTTARNLTTQTVAQLPYTYTDVPPAT